MRVGNVQQNGKLVRRAGARRDDTGTSELAGGDNATLAPKHPHPQLHLRVGRKGQQQGRVVIDVAVFSHRVRELNDILFPNLGTLLDAQRLARKGWANQHVLPVPARCRHKKHVAAEQKLQRHLLQRAADALGLAQRRHAAAVDAHVKPGVVAARREVGEELANRRRHAHGGAVVLSGGEWGSQRVVWCGMSEGVQRAASLRTLDAM